MLMPGVFGVRGFSGAVARITLLDGYVVEVNGRAGGLGRATLTLPLFELTAAGTGNKLSIAELVAPKLRPVPVGRARLVAPSYRLDAMGTATVALDYEAYAVNLLEAASAQPNARQYYAVTRFSNYPFDRIVRYNGHYYGVSAAGLFLLEGDTDNGAPIPWVARTALDDFGTTQLKRPLTVYLNARIADTTTVRVVAGEKSENSYLCSMRRGVNSQNHRVVVGKGVRSTHFALELSDAQGKDFELNSVDFRVVEHKRTV